MRNILTEEEYLRKVQEIHEGRITVLENLKIPLLKFWKGVMCVGIGGRLLLITP